MQTQSPQRRFRVCRALVVVIVVIQDVGWHILHYRGWRDLEQQYRSLPAAYMHNGV
jgi:hypothetical protein